LPRLRLLVPLSLLYAGGRLVPAGAAGAGAFLLLPAGFRLADRLTAAWIIGVAVFLGLTALAVIGAAPQRLRERARRLDPRRWVILALIVAAAAISLLALTATLEKPPNETASGLAWRLGLAGLAVLASWTLTHTTFALHYAHHFYGDGPAPGVEDDRGGLAFPGGDLPDFWDFLYFSFVVGMTCQVSDVQVTTRSLRRLTLLHGVLSFFFNTIILALAVNLLASSL
jgi:uncharacterized membrane protein